MRFGFSGDGFSSSRCPIVGVAAYSNGLLEGWPVSDIQTDSAPTSSPTKRWEPVGEKAQQVEGDFIPAR